MSERFEVIDCEEAEKLGLPIYRGSKFFWLVVENLPDGTKQVVGEDGGEPEDQLLVRDWKWVAPALNAAFEAGKVAGAVAQRGPVGPGSQADSY